MCVNQRTTSNVCLVFYLSWDRVSSLFSVYTRLDDLRDSRASPVSATNLVTGIIEVHYDALLCASPGGSDPGPHAYMTRTLHTVPS